MKIRCATRADKPAVLDFCKDTFSWGDYIADVWDSWLLEGNLLVIEEKNTVIALCHLSFSSNTAQVWIEGIRIHPNYRRRGYGTKLVLYAESLAKKKSCKIARMIIESKNKASLKLANLLGYSLEDKWRLYHLHPKKQSSLTVHAINIKQVEKFLTSSTYTSSWKWIPLKSDINELIKNKRVLVSLQDGKELAAGIWNKSEISSNVLQLGFINGNKKGMEDILRFMQNRGYELGSEKIQVFAQEKIHLQMGGLNKRSLFHLVRKDLHL